MEAGGWEEWRRLEGGEGLEGGDSMPSSFVVSGQLSGAHPDRKDRPVPSSSAFFQHLSHIIISRGNLLPHRSQCVSELCHIDRPAPVLVEHPKDLAR
eukprot:1366069-Rhodomonas_salina.1